MYKKYNYEDLINESVEPDKVELLRRITLLIPHLKVHKELDKFIFQAERVLFEENGRYFRAWLLSMSKKKRSGYLYPKELEAVCDDSEEDVKKQISCLLRELLTLQ